MNKYILLLSVAMVSVYGMEEVGSTELPLYSPEHKPEQKYKSWMLMNKGGGPIYVRIREDKEAISVIEPFEVKQHSRHNDDPDGSTVLFDRYDTAKYNLDTMKFPIRVRIRGQQGRLRQIKIDSLKELVAAKWMYPDWGIVSP